MREATVLNVVEFLVSEVFYKFGVPEVIHSDNSGHPGVSRARLARRLASLSDHVISHLHPADKIHLIRRRVQGQLHQAYERSQRQYNAQARVFQAEPGQEVYRRTFVLSDFGKALNAKFARKFLKARVVRRVGNNSFLLEDLKGKPLGVFHAKDIRM
ncbi:uncharacterized protein [Drosophila virilis]|uniref:uncharacterized protein n=1 Tax=Drosophila virilis TaxID=7244 RepID=UPI0038B30B80